MARGNAVRKGSGEPCISPLFSELTSEEYLELIGVAHHFDRNRGELVFQVGRPAEGLYVICWGKVKLVQHTPDRSKGYILDVLGPGDLLGEEAFFAQDVYTACAKALEPTRFCYLPGEDFIRFLERHPEICRRFLREFALKLGENFRARVELAYERSEVRLARMLLKLLRKFGTDGGDEGTIDLDLSRTDLAELLGIRAETAIRILSEWRDERILELDDRRIRVTDRQRLDDLAETSRSGRAEG